MIDRALASRLRAAARKFPVVTLTGPRQSGKTTPCRAGLLRYLRDSRRSEHIREHPLRGAVFETWVVDEVSKAWLDPCRRGRGPGVLP